MAGPARRAVAGALAAVGLLSAGFAAPASAEEHLTSRSVSPGATFDLIQPVNTPYLPPKPDIVLVVDRTGSMGPAVTDVKQRMANVIAAVRASQPDAQFAVAGYCDHGEKTPAFSVASPLSPSAASVIDAMIALPLCHGGDLPEAQLDALWQVGSGGGTIGYRPDSSRIIAWFGDAPGHPSSGGHSEAAAIRSLKAAAARVVAVSVGRDQLDATGQASRITRATGGALLRGVSANDVASSILAGITSLEVEVTAAPDCDRGLQVRLAPKKVSVVSGKRAVFRETVSVAEDAVPGSTLTCRVPFTIAGADAGPAYTQVISVTVEDSGTEDPSTDDPTPTDEPSTDDPTPTDDPTTDEPTPTEDPTTADPTPTDEPTSQEPSPSEESSPSGDSSPSGEPSASEPPVGPDPGDEPTTEAPATTESASTSTEPLLVAPEASGTR